VRVTERGGGTDKASNSVEAQVLRTAKAARITPRSAALVLAERAENGAPGDRLGLGSSEAAAAALRGLAQLYGGRAKAAMLDELRDQVRRIADDASLDPGARAVAMVRLVERGVVDLEPRAAVLDHLRRLAGDRETAWRVDLANRSGSGRPEPKPSGSSARLGLPRASLVGLDS
jgi:hypothetical protein